MAVPHRWTPMNLGTGYRDTAIHPPYPPPAALQSHGSFSLPMTLYVPCSIRRYIPPCITICATHMHSALTQCRWAVDPAAASPISSHSSDDFLHARTTWPAASQSRNGSLGPSPIIIVLHSCELGKPGCRTRGPHLELGARNIHGFALEARLRGATGGFDWFISHPMARNRIVPQKQVQETKDHNSKAMFPSILPPESNVSFWGP
jgi:hypothetical protein